MCGNNSFFHVRLNRYAFKNIFFKIKIESINHFFRLNLYLFQTFNNIYSFSYF